jgi:hypothetical protein
MRDTLQAFIKFFVSLRLTVVLLALSIVLVFAATLAQTDLGVWGVHQRFFHTFIVLWPVQGVPLPVFPGGYFIGGLLLLNLIAAHVYRFRLEWRKLGIQLAHSGVILLLVGELLTGLWQEEFQMSIDTGETKNYAESYRHNELALINTTDPQFDQVVAIPEQLLTNGTQLQHPQLPFRIVVKNYWPNADLHGPAQPPGQIPGSSLATKDVGPRLSLTPLPPTYKDNERNLPAASIELFGPKGSLGVWLVSPMLASAQSFVDDAGHTWQLTLRLARDYQPFSLTLLKFSHDVYPGTTTPKNYSSRVRLKSADGADDREVLIYMNNPLRYRGLTFYQASFANNNQTTILQVVRNPSWTLPYVSCTLVGLGLFIQFAISLFGFIRKRQTATESATAATASRIVP